MSLLVIHDLAILGFLFTAILGVFGVLHATRRDLNGSRSRRLD